MVKYFDHRYEEFIDPELKILLSCSQVIVHVLRSLSDKALLPYNIEEYAWSLRRAYDHVKEIARQQVTTSTPGLNLEAHGQIRAAVAIFYHFRWHGHQQP